MTMRFRNPIKLGVASESWLKHEGRLLEWTAATWRYFFWATAALGFSAAVASSDSSSTGPGDALRLRRLVAFPLLTVPFAGLTLVVVAVLIVELCW